MVDIQTHKIVDLIDSRDLEDVEKWLRTYKNLQAVSRDGSIIYKKAITSAFPNAIQISDRFHLLKNLTDYSKEYLKNKFEPNIIVDEKIKVSTLRKDQCSQNRWLTLG